MARATDSGEIQKQAQLETKLGRGQMGLSVNGELQGGAAFPSAWWGHWGRWAREWAREWVISLSLRMSVRSEALADLPFSHYGPCCAFGCPQELQWPLPRHMPRGIFW